MSDQELDLDKLFEQTASERVVQIVVEPQDSILAQALSQAALAAQADQADGADREADMYGRLGSIVRQLHESLQALGYDQFLRDVVGQVSDSHSRLEYIAGLTEQAATRVLNAVDETLPIQEQQREAALKLDTAWGDMMSGGMSIEEFKGLAFQSRDFVRDVAQHSALSKDRLIEIMMAQDFQDISGQVIKKVVVLTQRLESELAQLLKDYKPHRVVSPNGDTAEADEVDLKYGPSVPGHAMVQNEVDSLLSDLGF